MQLEWRAWQLSQVWSRPPLYFEDFVPNRQRLHLFVWGALQQRLRLKLKHGNSLRGINNCLVAARSVIKVYQKALDNRSINKLSLFQFKSIKQVTKKVAHGKKTHKNAKKNMSNCPLQLKMQFTPIFFLINCVLLKENICKQIEVPNLLTVLQSMALIIALRRVLLDKENKTNKQINYLGLTPSSGRRRSNGRTRV